MDILDLPGLITNDFAFPSFDDEEMRIFIATPTEDQKNCQKCGTVGNLSRFGIRKRSYHDIPIRQWRVRIWLHVRRFHCRSCGTTFVQRVEGMDPTRSMTTRCVEWIRQQCLRETFAHVAKDIGCDEKTVREIANAYIVELNAKHRPYMPEWLGIDENMLGKKYRCVLTDIDRGRPLDLLPDREKLTIAGWLWSFRDSPHLQGVTMDMSRPFQEAVTSVFPNIQVVIDKFHVVSMANAGLDSVRISLAKQRIKETEEKEKEKGISLRKNKAVEQAREEGREWMRSKALLRKRRYKLNKDEGEKLDKWLSGEPDLATAHHIKEEFSRFYEYLRKYEAEIALDKWRASVPKHLRGHFQKLLSATKNWKKEILAYFDYQKTNAYTESLNRIAKDINRQGRGYRNFNVLRARILFDPPPPDMRNFTKLSPGEKANYDHFLRGTSPFPEGIQQSTCWLCKETFPQDQLSFDVRKNENREILMICQSCQDRRRYEDLALSQSEIEVF